MNEIYITIYLIIYNIYKYIYFNLFVIMTEWN